MNSKNLFISFIAVVFLFLAPGCSQQQKGKTTDRPNIVWIVTEDMNPILGCYGDKLAKTPNIDKLAETGVVFQQAYSNAPICAPARSCLITGVYPTSMGTQHLRQEQTIPEWLKPFPKILSESGYFTSNQNKTDFNFNAEGVFNYHKEDLYPWRQRTEGQPFFSFFNIGDTHEGPSNSTENYQRVTANLSPEQFTSPDSVTLPPYYPNTPEMRKIWARYYDLAAAMDVKVGQILKNLEEDGLMENTIVFFFSDHGHGLPRYKRWLNIAGLRVPFVVHVPEKYKHLVKNKPGTENYDLVSFVDFAPSVLNLAGIEIPKHMNGIPVLGENLPASHEFLFATRSRADDMYELSRAIHDKNFIYVRHFLPHLPYIQTGIINSDGKDSYRELRRAHNSGEMPPAVELMWHHKPVEELYDLQADPQELNNLAASPENAEVLVKMRGLLKDQILKTRDAGFLFEPEMMMRSVGTTTYEMAHDTAKYDLEKIYTAAEMVGVAQPEEIGANLTDSDSGVRFWSVMGLMNSGEEAKSYIPQIEKLLADDSPTVQIAAAGLLCKLNTPKNALPVLGKWMNDERLWLALYAARTIQEAGKTALPLVPEIKKVLDKLSVDPGDKKPHPGSTRIYRDGNFASFTGWALEGALQEMGVEPKLKY
jgi:N-sulfoglucosamine sulfohydrolase